MILKIIMDSDITKIYNTNNFTRVLVSPKYIDNVSGYKNNVIVRIADGLPKEGDKDYTHKCWKKITINDEKHRHILYTPNQIYILNDEGKTIDML